MQRFTLFNKLNMAEHFKYFFYLLLYYKLRNLLWMVLGRVQHTEQSTEDKVQDCKCYSRALPLGRTKQASGKGKTSSSFYVE